MGLWWVGGQLVDTGHHRGIRFLRLPFLFIRGGSVYNLDALFEEDDGEVQFNSPGKWIITVYQRMIVTKWYTPVPLSNVFVRPPPPPRLG